MVGAALVIGFGVSVLTGFALLGKGRRPPASETVRDEIEELRADLERCQQLLGQRDRLSALGMLSASVAHEIRNPLVSVRTFAQLLPERLQDEEFCTSFRELALGEIDRISLLVNDLLSFARPAAPQVHPTDINEILEQIQRLVDGETKKRGITLSAELDCSSPPIALDEARVKQVFLNVVLNALQACDGGGTVTLTTRSVEGMEGPHLEVAVIDSGRGIPPSEVEHIFDPFFTTREGGSGLGLFIARQIVTDHGGFIDVHSTPGQGTTFRVSFPTGATMLEDPARSTEVTATDANDRSHRSFQHQ